MSNLIPDKNRKEIQKEYIYRILLIFFSLTFLSLILAILLIVPSYLVSNQRSELIERRLDFLRQYIESKQSRELPTIIRNTKERMEALSEERGLRVTKVLDIIDREKNAGISLNSFSFRSVPDGTHQFSLGGVSRTRDSLISFRDSLENEVQFNEVRLPISDLAESSDIEFSMNLIIGEPDIDPDEENNNEN